MSHYNYRRPSDASSFSGSSRSSSSGSHSSYQSSGYYSTSSRWSEGSVDRYVDRRDNMAVRLAKHILRGPFAVEHTYKNKKHHSGKKHHDRGYSLPMPPRVFHHGPDPGRPSFHPHMAGPPPPPPPPPPRPFHHNPDGFDAGFIQLNAGPPPPPDPVWGRAPSNWQPPTAEVVNEA